MFVTQQPISPILWATFSTSTKIQRKTADESFFCKCLIDLFFSFNTDYQLQNEYFQISNIVLMVNKHCLKLCLKIPVHYTTCVSESSKNLCGVQRNQKFSFFVFKGFPLVFKEIKSFRFCCSKKWKVFDLLFNEMKSFRFSSQKNKKTFDVQEIGPWT